MFHNKEILDLILKITRIKADIEFTEDYIKGPTSIQDFRKVFTPKKERNLFNFSEYPQVFSHKSGFQEDLSILDLLFNLGPDAKQYLESIIAQMPVKE